MNKKNNNISIFLSGIIVYITTIIVGYILFDNQMVGFPWVFWHFLVVIFFFGGVFLTYKTIYNFPEKQFLKTVFGLNIIIKIIILIYTYYFFKETIGIPVLSHKDPYYYHKMGNIVAQNFKNWNFDIQQMLSNIDFSDYGGIIYYGIIYAIFGDNIFIAGLVNVYFATVSVILLYKIIKKVDKEEYARLSAIIFTFFPIFNLYVGVHLKETIFIWLVLKGILLAFNVIDDKKLFSFKSILLYLVIFSLFLFRTVIALSFIISLFAYIILYRNTKKSLLSKFMIFLFFSVSIATLLQFQEINQETDKYYSKGQNDSGNVVEYKLEQTRGKTTIVKQFLGIPSQVILTLIGPFPTIIEYKEKIPTINHEEKIGKYSLISDAFVKAFLAFLFLIAIKNNSILKKNIMIISFLAINILIISVARLSLNIRFFMPTLPLFIYISSIGIYKISKYKFLLFLYLMAIIIIYIFFNFNKLLEINT